MSAAASLAAAGHAKSPPPRRALRSWLLEYGLSIGLLVAIVVIWQIVQSRPEALRYIMPTPGMIVRILVSDWSLFARNAVPTLLEALAGFVIGNAAGILIAVLFVYSRTIEDAFYPLAVTLRSLPLVAITPVLVVWLGPGYASKVALTALITFFPTLVNMVQGLAAAEVPALELMHTLAAPEPLVFLKIRLPFSLPYLFAAMRIAASAAVLGAMVAEWIGSTRGLGYIILQAMYNFQADRVWAVMVIGSFLSLMAYLAVVVAERLIVPWRGADEEPGGAD